MQYQSDLVIFDVYSPSGIGAATIQLETGSMPEQIVLQLHLTGLENLRVTSAENGIQASVSSGDPSQVYIYGAGSELPILPADPLWMPVEIVTTQPEKSIPLEGGYFKITLPKEFLRQAGDSFGFEWVDFYR